MSKFLNPNLIVAQMGLMQGETVADLGCGSGFYIVPAAQLVGPSGTVYAVDVQESKLAATISITGQFGYRNVRVVQADLEKPLLSLPEHCCDAVIAGNIFHDIGPKNRSVLVSNIYRLLKSPGRLCVVEWKKTAVPFGPPLEKRLDQQALETTLMQAGFRKLKDLEADNYHYAVLFEK